MLAFSERSGRWMPYAVLGAVFVILVALAAALVLADGLDSRNEGQRLAAGTPWAQQAIFGFGDGSPEDFSEFPLAWAGPAALGYRLQRIERQPESVDFVYGTCTVDETFCEAPFTVRVVGICDAPKDALEVVRQEDEGPVLAEVGEALYVLTAASAIEISGSLEVPVLRELPSALRPYGSSRSVLGAVFDEFPPPMVENCRR